MEYDYLPADDVVAFQIDEPDPEREIFADHTNLEGDEHTIDSKVELTKYELLEKGCRCKRNCVKQFSTEELLDSHLNTMDINYYCKNYINHLNLFTQGALNILVHTSAMKQERGHRREEQKAVFTQYQFCGVGVCQFTRKCSSL